MDKALPNDTNIYNETCKSHPQSIPKLSPKHAKMELRIPATVLAFAFAVKESGTKINRIQPKDSSKTGRRPKTLSRSSFSH